MSKQKSDHGVEGLESNEATETVLNLDPDKPIVLKMDVEEDVPAELEVFVRLSRLGLYQEALDWFDRCLSHFSQVFPVMAEYAEMLLEAGFDKEFGALFNTIPEDCQTLTGIQDADFEIASKLIEIWRAVGRVLWSDKPEKESLDLQRYWDYLETPLTEKFSWERIFDTPLDLMSRTPLLLQLVEVYLRLAVSLFKKGLLQEEKYTNPPWSPGSPRWAGFWEWHERLRRFNRHWEAQMIQSILLSVAEPDEILEFLSPETKHLNDTARIEPPGEPDEARMISELIMSNNLCSYFLQNLPHQIGYAKKLLEDSYALKEALCTMSRDNLTEMGKPILHVSELAEACKSKQPSWQDQLQEHCMWAKLPPPCFYIVSERRGGRTVWSSSVTVQAQEFAARYWYDGQLINNAREDAAEVAWKFLNPKPWASTAYPGQLYSQQFPAGYGRGTAGY